MTPERLSERYPELFHMAEDGSWPSIRRGGLLSTSAILDRLAVAESERARLERMRRPEKVRLVDPELGVIVLRDQKPLPEAKLAGCLLDGLTTAEWYQLLNARVFFWPTEQRLTTLLQARAYRGEAKIVLVVDTAALLQRHGQRVELSAINSGTVMPIARPRGLQTFLGLDAYERDEVAELAVLHSVPDIVEVVLRVERRTPDGRVATLFDSAR
jgi:hypothetical protein